MYFAPRVKVLTQSTSGTNDLTLADAPESGFQHFYSFVVSNDYVPYFILDADGVAWEEGVGQFDDGGPGFRVIYRSHIQGSSNFGSKLSLSTGDHTVILGAPAFLDNGLLAQVHTSVTQSLTTDTWINVEWSDESENYINGTTGGQFANDWALWETSTPWWITYTPFARQMRIHGVIAFSATTVAAGRYEVEIIEGIWATASDTKFHIEADGSTTDVTYVPFDKTMFWQTSMPDNYQIRVVRRGDDTGAGLYLPGCFLHAEVIR